LFDSLFDANIINKSMPEWFAGVKISIQPKFNRKHGGISPAFFSPIKLHCKTPLTSFKSKIFLDEIAVAYHENRGDHFRYRWPEMKGFDKNFE